MVLCSLIVTKPNFFNKRKRIQIEIGATNVERKYKINKNKANYLALKIIIIHLRISTKIK